jgi:hypothetical protein
MNHSPLVTVTRGALTIKECPAELATALVVSCTRVSFADGTRQTTSEFLAYAHYDVQSRLCRTYPNALGLVRRAAEKLGLELRIQEQRLQPPLNPKSIQSDIIEEIRDLLAEVVQAQSSGILLVRPQTETAAIIDGLVRLVPKHFKILVTMGDGQAAHRLLPSLSQSLGERPGIHVRPLEARARIMISCHAQLQDFAQGDLAYSGYALRDFDVWIADEAHRLADPACFPLIGQLRTVYSWGLTAHPNRADDSHRLMEVVFGPRLTTTAPAEIKTADLGLRLFVFPLVPAQPLAPKLAAARKIRAAYLQNPLLIATFKGIDTNLPEKAKVLFLLDSVRLMLQLRAQLPHYDFLDGRTSSIGLKDLDQRLESVDSKRILVMLSRGQRIKLPRADYVIDGTVATPLRPVHSNLIMVLCLGDEQLFEAGIAKINQWSVTDRPVNYMFERELVDFLPFSKAPLVAELGTFP